MSFADRAVAAFEEPSPRAVEFAAATTLSVAVDQWLDAVGSRFPWRARVCRWLARRSWGLRVLLHALNRG